MRVPVLAVVALCTALLALAAPLPAPAAGNPKLAAAAVVVAEGSSATVPTPSTAPVDPVADALASKLAAVSKALGRLPVLPVPVLLGPTPSPVVKVVAKALVVKNVKAAKTRRSVPLVANNPKAPRPVSASSTTTSSGRVFATASGGPVKVPVTVPPAVGNPKHAFVPSPAIKVVSYTLTAPGGRTTVYEAQGPLPTHPGEPKTVTRS